MLNDLDRLPSGLLKLPNLVAGMPVLVVVRLSVPPTAQEGELCRFRLAWNDPGQGERREVTVPLSLPVVAGDLGVPAPNMEVQERAALLLIARAKKAATLCLEQRGPGRGVTLPRGGAGDSGGRAGHPGDAARAQVLAEIEAYIESGDSIKFLKHAKYQAHQRRRSDPYRNV